MSLGINCRLCTAVWYADRSTTTSPPLTHDLYTLYPQPMRWLGIELLPDGVKRFADIGVVLDC